MEKPDGLLGLFEKGLAGFPISQSQRKRIPCFPIIRGKRFFAFVDRTRGKKDPLTERKTVQKENRRST